MNWSQIFDILQEEHPFTLFVITVLALIAVVGWALAPWIIGGLIKSGLNEIHKAIERGSTCAGAKLFYVQL